MKLNINYTGTEKGYSLEIDLDIAIEKDAESLGYATMVLFKAAEKLAEYGKTANPKYHARIQRGINKAVSEMENNPIWPLDKTIVQDE